LDTGVSSWGSDHWSFVISDGNGLGNGESTGGKGTGEGSDGTTSSRGFSESSHWNVGSRTVTEGSRAQTLDGLTLTTQDVFVRWRNKSGFDSDKEVNVDNVRVGERESNSSASKRVTVVKGSINGTDFVLSFIECSTFDDVVTVGIGRGSRDDTSS